MSELTRSYTEFKAKYPKIWTAYDQLGAAAHAAGPLKDEKTRELVKLGIAIGARFEGAVHAHVRRALESGATPEEIRQVALLAVTTMGFPSMMTTLSWVEDVLKEK